MKRQLLFISALFLIVTTTAWSQHYPFPQQTDYHEHIKPSNYSQEQLNAHVTSFYDGWKDKYLINGCEDDQYYVYFASGNTNTVSEAMGYGMMIVPLMAGYDPDARVYFDGLYRYYKAHPSHVMPNLMAWKQITDCVDADGPDSASDGDIDIAFGLLLAHAQWGSQGAINYFQEALLIIADMMGEDASEGDINQDYNTVKLGDWVTGGSYSKGTRTSDFIMDHFRAFACAINDTSWNDVVDECYFLIDEMQTNYSPATGLLPDFIEDVDTEARPADPDFLEGENDGDYSYNACRDPWRIASDYLISGDERARDAVIKINRWLIESTGGSAHNIKAGYHLDGTQTAGWSDISFTAPFAVGAMLDTENQEWLNKLYSKIISANIANGGYYDNTLKLLAMITLSGNYWVPSCDILNSTSNLQKETNDSFKVFPSSTTGIINIEIKPELINKPLNIKVFNSFGQQTYGESVLNNSKIAIDLGRMPKGVYLVSLSNENQIIGTQKVIKD